MTSSGSTSSTAPVRLSPRPIRFAAPSVTIDLPPAHLELSAWLLADELLARLRDMAEEIGFLEPRAHQDAVTGR